MPAALLAVAAREPRRARYPIPRDLPRRGEIIAALWALTLIGHLLLAQLTILLAVAFQGVSRVSRWRPQGLAVPPGGRLLLRAGVAVAGGRPGAPRAPAGAGGPGARGFPLGAGRRAARRAGRLR